jgi:hypothetical protein
MKNQKKKRKKINQKNKDNEIWVWSGAITMIMISGFAGYGLNVFINNIYSIWGYLLSATALGFMVVTWNRILLLLF